MTTGAQPASAPAAPAPRFIVESGREVVAVTADQMREIDRIAIEETGRSYAHM
jgi:hypothetical protein